MVQCFQCASVNVAPLADDFKPGPAKGASIVAVPESVLIRACVIYDIPNTVLKTQEVNAAYRLVVVFPVVAVVDHMTHQSARFEDSANVY